MTRARATLLAAIVLSWALLASPASAKPSCSMKGSEPSSGTMSLQFLRASTGKGDGSYGDYLITGTIRWNSQDALDCFSAGHVDWAYEHNLEYLPAFSKRKLWGATFDRGLTKAGAYLDSNPAFSDPTVTDLTFGILSPDKLTANQTYSYAYQTMLPRSPTNGAHSMALAGQIAEKRCNNQNCVNLPKSRGYIADPVFVGRARPWSATGQSCWAWTWPGTASRCPAAPSIPLVQPIPDPGYQPLPTLPTLPQGGGPAPGVPSVSLGQGPATSAGYRYAISLRGFSPSSAVSIVCRDSVDPGGFYAFTMTTDSGGNASTASYCYSGDGPDHWFTANGVESNHVAWGGSSPAPAPAPAPAPTWSEQETPNHPVNTFTNYHNASGMGQAIAAGQWVQVSCKVYDAFIGSVSPDGYWYRIASAPWSNAYYSPANTFMNGDPVGGPYAHNTDFAVPNC